MSPRKKVQPATLLRGAREQLRTFTDGEWSLGDVFFSGYDGRTYVVVSRDYLSDTWGCVPVQDNGIRVTGQFLRDARFVERKVWKP
jgi:hypothetical protein